MSDLRTFHPFSLFSLLLVFLAVAPVAAGEVEGRDRIENSREGMEVTRGKGLNYDLPEDAERYKKGGVVILERTEGYVARKTKEMNERLDGFAKELEELKAEVGQIRNVVDRLASAPRVSAEEKK